MHSRHLTGHAVDLVALGGGEISCSERTTSGSQPPCRPRRASSEYRCAGLAAAAAGSGACLPHRTGTRSTTDMPHSGNIGTNVTGAHMTIGILGAGNIGATLARKLSVAGHTVLLANSR
ncbi:MAG: hypothetical protein K0S35_3712, partial [Geminicoccaceae bacterium]|nr:hypothetical protein [Geminicoccaceae bacterium]